jgi:photosystem I P700 chlorophyll a apoprotein A2
LCSIPIGHSIWDPHFSSYCYEAYSSLGTASGGVASYSGLYNVFLTIGVSSDFDLYKLVIGFQILSLISILLGRLHLVYIDSLILADARHKSLGSEEHTSHMHALVYNSYQLLAFLNASGLRLNFHLGALFGVSSIAWSGHLIHVALPASRGVRVTWSNVFSVRPVETGLTHFLDFDWGAWTRSVDIDSHVFGSYFGAGSSLLTFIGGFK